MKITKSQLKQIIKEELSGTLQEDGHTDVPSAARKLKASVEDAMNILSILETHPDANLPSWWMSKVTLASDYLNKARDYVLYDGQPIQEEEELDERCQKGYKTHPTRKTKKMYGKTYRNCVKAEDKKPTQLTKGEIEKRKEIADAIKEKNPGISDDKKFAFATATVKKMRKK